MKATITIEICNDREITEEHNLAVIKKLVRAYWERILHPSNFNRPGTTTKVKRIRIRP